MLSSLHKNLLLMCETILVYFFPGWPHLPDLLNMQVYLSTTDWNNILSLHIVTNKLIVATWLFSVLFPHPILMSHLDTCLQCLQLRISTVNSSSCTQTLLRGSGVLILKCFHSSRFLVFFFLIKDDKTWCFRHPGCVFLRAQTMSQSVLCPRGRVEPILCSNIYCWNNEHVFSLWDLFSGSI